MDNLELEEVDVKEMAESILRVAEAGEKLLASGLTRRAIIILLQDKIGSAFISQQKIGFVLDAIPKLKAYIKALPVTKEDK